MWLWVVEPSGQGDTSYINVPNNPINMALAHQFQTAVKQGVTAHTCHRNTPEAEAGGRRSHALRPYQCDDFCGMEGGSLGALRFPFASLEPTPLRPPAANPANLQIQGSVEEVVGEEIQGMTRGADANRNHLGDTSQNARISPHNRSTRNAPRI